MTTPTQSSEAAQPTPRPIHSLVSDPDHQDLVNTINNMARAALEKDEEAYDAFYFGAIKQLDELHERFSKHGGFEP